MAETTIIYLDIKGKQRDTFILPRSPFASNGNISRYESMLT